MREMLGGVPLECAEVLSWAGEYIRENQKQFTDSGIFTYNRGRFFENHRGA
jgi:hypothetical protein